MCIHAGAFVSLNCVDVIQIENIQIAFVNENGFEVKEKKEKGNLEIKVFFLKVVKFIFGNLPKIVHFYLN